jgi:WD40 repeat protein
VCRDTHDCDLDFQCLQWETHSPVGLAEQIARIMRDGQASTFLTGSRTHQAVIITQNRKDRPTPRLTRVIRSRRTFLTLAATMITVSGALVATRPWGQPDKSNNQTSRPSQFVGALTDTGEVRSLVISSDGKILATGGGNNHTARLWSTATGNHLHTINTGYVVDDVTFNRDGKLLSTAADVWNVDTGELAGKVEVYGYSSAFSPNGETLAVSSNGGTTLATNDDTTVRFWRLSL